MTIRAFISYAHADEAALTRLHRHLAVLRREGDVEAWTDREIRPGDQFERSIQQSLGENSVFIALVSADFLASSYCYEKEFAFAQARETAGTIRIIPIILQPCDWRSTPLGNYQALPKEGKPISEWANENNAYLDIVNGLRRLLAEPASASELKSAPATPISGRRPRIKRDFDAIEKSEFADAAFAAVSSYFASSCAELSEVGEGTLKGKFEKMSDAAFTCTVVNRGRSRNSEAHITVMRSRGRRFFGDINYVNAHHAEPNSSNGSVRVDADEFEMYLVMDEMFGGQTRERLTSKDVAERLWLAFVARAGIEYD